MSSNETIEDLISSAEEYPSEKELMELTRLFQEWVVERREALYHQQLDLERYQHNQAPLIASIRGRTGLGGFVQQYERTCVRLAEIKSDLSVFDTYYLKAKGREEECYVDFGDLGMRLLWEWFLREKG